MSWQDIQTLIDTHLDETEMSKEDVETTPDCPECDGEGCAACDDTGEDTQKGLMQFTKRDDEQRIVWGWANVSVHKGQEICDHQGDYCSTVELQKAAHKFMENRTGKTMHSGKKTSVVVDSIVFTPELKKALQIDPQSYLGQHEGWFVGVHVRDDKTWDRVKKGELRSFSFGGSAQRIPITDEEN